MAKLLNIITIPNQILRNKSKEISEENINQKDFQILREDMKRTMIEKDGLGLAAPQIGKNIQLVMVNTRDGILEMHNPVITKRSIFKESGVEGCLSIPDTYGSVKRHKKIICQYVNEKGVKKTERATGLLARVIQHEVDHLNGVLFIDKAKNIERITEEEKEEEEE